MAWLYGGRQAITFIVRRDLAAAAIIISYSRIVVYEGKRGPNSALNRQID